MKVFISWSGARSKAVAGALRDWLPSVIQAVQPWMSANDIDKGVRWGSDMAAQLQEARAGIICLTAENLNAPWILFEAGALSKTLDKTFVCPYLFDIEPTSLEGPLVQFQATTAQKEDTRRLVHTINRAMNGGRLPEPQLDKYFERWWPDLEASFKNIESKPEAPKPQRSEKEMLEEILELVRDKARESYAFSKVRENLMSQILPVLSAAFEDESDYPPDKIKGLDFLYCPPISKFSPGGWEKSAKLFYLPHHSTHWQAKPDLRAFKGEKDKPAEIMVNEAALLSEQALAEDWNRPEEDEAWLHLQPQA
ncbi:MAG TPA: TIR domain-containing protein [Pyrinomonadaceae bacterium]|nr:TIR domain-containing protein [Pyrinomonadaceae bacterium]